MNPTTKSQPERGCTNHCEHDIFFSQDSGAPNNIVRCFHTDVCGDSDCSHVCTFSEPAKRPSRLGEITTRRDKAHDPQMGYAFAKRPTWGDIDYLLSVIQGAESRVKKLYDDKAPLSVFRDEVLSILVSDSDRVHEIAPVSRRTQIIREQQRSGGGEVTAIMVSQCGVETASGGLLGAVHSLFHGSDFGCAYGGMSCPVRIKAERLLRGVEETRVENDHLRRDNDLARRAFEVADLVQLPNGIGEMNALQIAKKLDELGHEIESLHETNKPPLRPRSAWHEDYGDVLWWHLPINEPPHFGSPMNSDWEERFDDYYTHWSPVKYPIEATEERP